MTTPVNRRMTSMQGGKPQRSSPTPERIWLYLVLGTGLAVMSLIGVAALAMDFSGPASALRAENAVKPATVVAAVNNNSAAERAAGLDDSTDKAEQPVETKESEATPVPPPMAVTQAEPGPSPEPAPANVMKSPERPHKTKSEQELRLQLRDVAEFGLKPTTRDALVESYKKNYQSNAAMGRKPTFDPSVMLSHMPSAQQLPVRSFPNCQLNELNAETLGKLSRALHAYLDTLAPRDANGKRADPKRVRAVLRQEWRGKPPAWLHPLALPAMTQILMAEDVPLRLILVDMMADIPGRAASIRLAQRAIYDLSPEVRKAAIDALAERPLAESRRTLVDAMRYPWPVAADNAADALVALNDRDAAPLLVATLDKPNPAAPYATKTGASIKEVVRVNHVQNCLLCHVPAVGRDPVTDVDPFARRPDQTYQVGRYGGPTLPGSSGGGVWANRVLIRADVQFLRQDFSVSFPSDNYFSTDGGLRFDFIVRTRPLDATELQTWKYQIKPDATAYPQREAALYALRAITGQDLGATTEAWAKLYPHAKAEADGVRLAASLRAAQGEQRELLLARYREAKEDHYTEGLAHAIPHVTVKMREKVRTALVERMARLKPDELRAYLEDDDELRLAAARACGRKADPDMIPELIALLTDDDEKTSDFAHDALKKITGEDFGPMPKSTQDERVAAVGKWRAWLEHNGR